MGCIWIWVNYQWSTHAMRCNVIINRVHHQSAYVESLGEVWCGAVRFGEVRCVSCSYQFGLTSPGRVQHGCCGAMYVYSQFNLIRPNNENFDDVEEEDEDNLEGGNFEWILTIASNPNKFNSIPSQSQVFYTLYHSCWLLICSVIINPIGRNRTYYNN